MQTYDLLVVGAGVVGAFHAYHAARRGLSTLLVERDALPNQASTRNFGMVSETIVAPGGEWAGHAQASLALYRDLQQAFDIGVVERGSLYLAATVLEDRVLRECAQIVPSCQYLAAGDLQARYPFVQPAYGIGALLFPNDLAIDPRRMLAQFIPQLVAQHGVIYRPHTSIIAVEEATSHCIARAADGTIFAAAHVILCSGAECDMLFPGLLRESGMQVCKLQMLQTAPQPAFRLPHTVLSGLSIRRYPVFAACESAPALAAEPIAAPLRDAGIHVMFTQATDGGIVFGDSHEYRPIGQRSQLDETTNWAINAQIIAYAQHMLRLPSWRLQWLWNGFYLTHPDLPIFTARVGQRTQIVTGIGGKGMTTGPGFAHTTIGALS